jgi:hypothetical protein
MRLKLEQIPKRTLEIERPDGKIISLVLKRFRVDELPDLEAENKEIEVNYRMGKINVMQFYHQMITLITENFNPDDFADLDAEHLTEISNSLKELKANKPEAEKKSPGQKNSRSSS